MRTSLLAAERLWGKGCRLPPAPPAGAAADPARPPASRLAARGPEAALSGRARTTGLGVTLASRSRRVPRAPPRPPPLPLPRPRAPTMRSAALARGGRAAAAAPPARRMAAPSVAVPRHGGSGRCGGAGRGRGGPSARDRPRLPPGPSEAGEAPDPRVSRPSRLAGRGGTARRHRRRRVRLPGRPRARPARLLRSARAAPLLRERRAALPPCRPLPQPPAQPPRASS
jgi:hypothetical protein